MAYNLDDPDYDAHRYDSAIGWDGSDGRGKKWKPKPPRKAPLFELAKHVEHGRKTWPLRPLFGDLWGEREVAVLAGETGVGKSVLAVQLAELLARGRLSPQVPARRVLYVDLEHTTNQFEDRYSAPRHAHQPVRRVRYRFAKRFQRLVPGYDQEPEAKFRGNVGRYFCNELGRALDLFEADIAIVDNLSFLIMGGGSSAAAERAMLTLRTIIRTFWRPVSILVTAHLKSERKPGPITLNDLAGSRRIAELADTVFTLGRSHLSEDLRYLKHLKSRRKAPLLSEERWMPASGRRGGGRLDADNVAVLQLSRRPAPPSMNSAKRKTDNSSSLSIVHSPLSIAPSIVNPFLGLTHVGFSNEHDHFPTPPVEKRVRTRKDDDLIEALLSGKYGRYLER